jgi:hypothetical protein
VIAQQNPSSGHLVKVPDRVLQGLWQSEPR